MSYDNHPVEFYERKCTDCPATENLIQFDSRDLGVDLGVWYLCEACNSPEATINRWMREMQDLMPRPEFAEAMAYDSTYNRKNFIPLPAKETQ